MNKLITFLIIFIGVARLQAADFSYDGLDYSVISETEKTCQVAKNSTVSGEIIIPTTVQNGDATYTVTFIKGSAFEGCTELTAIRIPSTVTGIGQCAFNSCTQLKSVVFDDSESPISLSYNSYTISTVSIGKGQFYDCPLETLYIGREVTYDSTPGYGYSPFYNVKTLSEVTIGCNVTSIADCAFKSCSGLKTVIFEDGESPLSLGCNYLNTNGGGTGQGLFYNCSLETLYLGRNLTYNSSLAYGYSPFYNNGKIKEVTIGNTVTTIGKYAFYGCERISAIELPNSLSTIGDYAFVNCN